LVAMAEFIGILLVRCLGWWFGRARMVLRVVPIEDRGNVGCGDVFELIAEKFHGNIP